MKIELEKISREILQIVNDKEPLLSSIPEKTTTDKLNQQNRNIKQLVGHLIDYTRQNDLWIQIQDYEHEDWKSLVQLWKYYNYHLAHIIKSVDEKNLNRYWCDAEGMKISLLEMIVGYLAHLHLHVNEIEEMINT